MGAYQGLRIFYFSGTGNALSAARWIGERAAQEGMSSHLYNIERLEKVELPQVEGRTLLGFCYPTHGFIAPWIMLKFLWRFPRLSNSDVFFVNTRAGFGLYAIHNGPGVSGVAQWFPILLFMLRGYRVVGSLPLDMPHSWISFFWPNTKKQIRHITARCERIVGELCSRMFQGERYFRYSVWITLPLDLLVSTLCIPYLLAGRFFLGKTLFASYRCDGCKLCVTSCPVSAIAMVDRRPYWKATCESCMRCMNVCPKRAIQSWVTRIGMLTIGLISLGTWLWPFNQHLWFLLISALFFPIYRLLHVLWGWRFINQAFTVTSLTHVWHRYLAPGVKVATLRKPSIDVSPKAQSELAEE